MPESPSSRQNSKRRSIVITTPCARRAAYRPKLTPAQWATLSKLFQQETDCALSPKFDLSLFAKVATKTAQRLIELDLIEAETLMLTAGKKFPVKLIVHKLTVRGHLIYCEKQASKPSVASQTSAP